jgi:hypothetical protein
MEELYHIFKKIVGPKEAKHALLDSIAVALYEIEESGLEVTEETISDRLQEVLKDFQEASKNNVA